MAAATEHSSARRGHCTHQVSHWPRRSRLSRVARQLVGEGRSQPEIQKRHEAEERGVEPNQPKRLDTQEPEINRNQRE